MLDCRQLSGCPFCPDLGTLIRKPGLYSAWAPAAESNHTGLCPRAGALTPPMPTHGETQAWLLRHRGPDWTPALPCPETPGKSYTFRALYGSVGEVPILCLQHTHNRAVQPTPPSHGTFYHPREVPMPLFRQAPHPSSGAHRLRLL